MNRLDLEWEKWGRKDPYYGVLSHARFRAENLDAEARREFFDSGVKHIDAMLDTVRGSVKPGFAPRRALDFGCGVGRLLLPLARHCATVTGADISPAMLAEARRNCEAAGLRNVEFVMADEDLRRIQGTFDFIHSFIVFQHIPAARGERILARLVDHLDPGGVGALHFTTARRASRPHLLLHRLRWSVPLLNSLANLLKGRRGEPLMIVDLYDPVRLLNILRDHGCGQVCIRHTEHAGLRGMMLFFEKREYETL